MKNLNSVLVIFLISITSLITGQVTHFDGFWYHPYTKANIRAKSYYDGVKVLGIHSSRRWTYFERCGNNTYRDKSDNLLKFINRNRMVYYDHHKRSKFTYYPVSHQNNDLLHDYGYYENNEAYSDNRNYKNNQESQTDSGGRITIGKIKKSRDLHLSLSPEGTWKVNDPDKTVFIIDTRDGIKARFSDDSRWYIFKNDNDNPGIYTAESGHRYEYVDENTLVWKDINGKRQYILTRMKDSSR